MSDVINFDKANQVLLKVLSEARDQLDILEENEKDLINTIRNAEVELEDVRHDLELIRERIHEVDSLINTYTKFKIDLSEALDKFPDLLGEVKTEPKKEKEEPAEDDSNYISIIRKAYISNELNLAANKGLMIGKKSKKYDGIIYNYTLYLRGEVIDTIIKREHPNTKREDWVNYLDKHKALKGTKNKSKTSQLPGCNTINFYAIRLSVLNNFHKEDDE